MANVGGNTRATLDIVQSELRDTRVELQEEGEGLADTTSRAKDSDLGGLLITQCQQSMPIDFGLDGLEAQH